MIFTALALVVQSLAVFSPPEAVNASSGADFVNGGVSSVRDFLTYYDNNSNNIKDIFNSLGVTRAEIASAEPTVIGEESRYNWSMTSLYSAADGQRSWNYGGKDPVYYRPMRLTERGGDRHEVFAAHSASIGWFAIKKDCGNLITETPPRPKEPEAACVNLNVVPVANSRTKFRFNGKASKENGADIYSYVYRVFDENDKRVDEVVSINGKEQDSVLYEREKPGTYTVKLVPRTSTGRERDANCIDKFTVTEEAKPAALCRSVKAEIHNRTIVSLRGSARTENGATISKYTFVVRDKDGKEVKRVSVNSSEQSVAAPSFTLKKAGDYTVKLTVTTSVGEKTNSDSCKKPFTIVPVKKCPVNPNLPENSPECQPCPGNPEIWIKDEDCSAELISTKTGRNLTQGNIHATTKLASAGDKISYTLTVENKGLVSSSVNFTENLTDIVEYAAVIDAGGGVYSQEAKTLTWPNVSVAAGKKQSRTFVVQLLAQIPLTNTGKSDEASYDCTMVNTFGNTVSVGVDCPPEKVLVETTVSELPTTGPGENILFGGTLFSVVTYFYARSRQLGKEVRLIRKNVNAGAL